MEALKRAKILFDAWNNRRSIEKAHDLTKEYTLIKFSTLLGKTPRQDEFPLHPAYGQISFNKIKGIESYKEKNPNSKNETIIIGDSLSDFTRDDLSSCKPELNLALAGQGSSYYEKILIDTAEVLKGVDVKYVVMECWGNEFLGYFDLNTVKSHAFNNFNLARSLYPNAKIILIGLPPIYDLYANMCKYEFDSYLFTLACTDSNSIFLAIWEKFSGAFGIFPKINYSSDGVHFAGEGIIRYDKLIEEAKTSNQKIIL